MGMSASKRVRTTLTSSSEFDSACDSSYERCLSLTQHAFQGVLPYQLFTASTHLHQTLSSSPHLPLVHKWVPSPPSREQVDSALRVIARQSHKSDSKSSASGPEEEGENGVVLGPVQFKEWAVVLFADAVVGNAGKAVLSRVPIGIAGIAGIGAVTRSGKDLIVAAIGVYALGVSTSIYLSLSGCEHSFRGYFTGCERLLNVSKSNFKRTKERELNVDMDYTRQQAHNLKEKGYAYKLGKSGKLITKKR